MVEGTRTIYYISLICIQRGRTRVKKRSDRRCPSNVFFFSRQLHPNRVVCWLIDILSRWPKRLCMFIEQVFPESALNNTASRTMFRFFVAVWLVFFFFSPMFSLLIFHVFGRLFASPRRVFQSSREENRTKNSFRLFERGEGGVKKI